MLIVIRNIEGVLSAAHITFKLFMWRLVLRVISNFVEVLSNLQVISSSFRYPSMFFGSALSNWRSVLATHSPIIVTPTLLPRLCKLRTQLILILSNSSLTGSAPETIVFLHGSLFWKTFEGGGSSEAADIKNPSTGASACYLACLCITVLPGIQAC